VITAGERQSPAPGSSPRRPWSGFVRYAVRRVLVLPAQLLFVLLVLYVAIEVPSTFAHNAPESGAGYLLGFAQAVVNDFTGNWGQADILSFHLPWTVVYAYYIPTSVQLALFALPIAAAIAYPVSLLAGWSRRPAYDAPARLLTLLGALLPVFVVGTLVLNAVFFSYLGWFQDLPSQGLIPSSSWFLDRGGYPSWILYDAVTRPTGFPLVDALLHHAWQVAAISLTKTLIQASVVAIAYVAIFFRHARSIVRSESGQGHIVGARSRGVAERTLLWRHAARTAAPSFLLVFALTIPEYLVVQFAVEAAFVDQAGFGYLTFAEVTQGSLAPLEPLVFLLALLVLTWTLVVDLLARAIDPRELNAR
jgi:ABC-type dipeptide/oligopeptide/nickel transport system permease component